MWILEEETNLRWSVVSDKSYLLFAQTLAAPPACEAQVSPC